jgi:[glutamine synthetase] adenylyltransferase / [glutamine synthetase]-adenylyl-L-tyrosine phosphorylase
MSTSRSSGALASLAKYGFTDLDGTIAKLDELVSLVGDSGRSSLASISKSANPDQALDYLIRLSRDNKTAVKKVLSKEESALRLCKLLGASSALAEFVQLNPAVISEFDAEPKLLVHDGYVNLLLASVSDIKQSSAQLITNLRKAYRTELVKIAIFDLSASDPMSVQQKVSLALADIAAAALEAGLAIARRELFFTSDHGLFSQEEVMATKLAVIGMGKGGAGELNYISDVDVIFVAEAKDESIETSRMLEVATKLATRMMRAMDSTNPEPPLWQVDANLRPEGKAGALVRTLDSHISYYSRWAENWEFQALLKARPMAGDRELGEAYFDAMNPLVWESTQRENFVESVQKMRERVSGNIPQDEVDRQIKLGPGGLRDIEFTVQLMQLVHGRTDSSVRAADTLTAIDELSSGGYMGRAEAAEFSGHYKFLRVLEHRIQMSKMRRTHLMPIDQDEQRSIARSINLAWSAEELQSVWAEVKLEVRALHQRIFYRPLLAAVSKAGGDLELSNEQASDRLLAIGYLNPEGALQHIKALTSGLTRRAQIQRQLLPVLLQWFSEGTDPDSALLAFRRLSENLGESHWYLRMLRDSSGAAERLSIALSNSRLATSLLELIPEGAAWFEDPDSLKPTSLEDLNEQSSSLASRHEDLDDFAKAVRHIRRRETLRLALGAVVGELNIVEIATGLSDLSEWYLSTLTSAIKVSMEMDGESSVDFGIVAMGRFGGQELGFGSDADLMFVYRTVDTSESERSQKQAERIISELHRLVTDPQLEFQIDMDLRPEGKNGSVARSIDSYRAYYSRWGDIWENQALLRARMIYGSEALVAEFNEVIDKYRYPEELAEKSVIEIRRIKARMETERLPQGADPKRHLKLGRGSLSDIEWLVQLLQLKHGSEHPEIRTPKTLDALDALVECNLIEGHEAKVLRDAWILTSRVRSSGVLWSNKLSDVLSLDRRQLEGMARILEYPRGSASALEEDYLAHTRRSRQVFERVFFA